MQNTHKSTASPLEGPVLDRAMREWLAALDAYGAVSVAYTKKADAVCARAQIYAQRRRLIARYGREHPDVVAICAPTLKIREQNKKGEVSWVLIASVVEQAPPAIQQSMKNLGDGHV